MHKERSKALTWWSEHRSIRKLSPPLCGKTIWRFAPNQPLRDFRTADELVETAASPRRFTMLLLGIFAGLALALAAVGIYGVIAYSVGQRTREMGIRMALGASPGMLEWQVAKEALLLSVAGALIGLVGLAAFASPVCPGTSPRPSGVRVSNGRPDRRGVFRGMDTGAAGGADRSGVRTAIRIAVAYNLARMRSISSMHVNAEPSEPNREARR